MVMKSALRRKSLDNISAMIFCFEEMGKLFEKKEHNKNKEIMKFNSLIDIKNCLNFEEFRCIFLIYFELKIFVLVLDLGK